MILSAVDTIPDVFKTVVNVTANMSVAVIVARWMGVPIEPPAPGSRAEEASEPASDRSGA